MDNRLNASYFVSKHGEKTNKCTVYIRITISGVKDNINTGVTVMKDQWDVSKSRIKGKSDVAVSGNKLIRTLQTKITDAYTDYVKQNLPITLLRNQQSPL